MHTDNKKYCNLPPVGLVLIALSLSIRVSGISVSMPKSDPSLINAPSTKRHKQKAHYIINHQHSAAAAAAAARPIKGPTVGPTSSSDRVGELLE